ncbi:hypothetical protein GW17_00046466, partial [Ensete ventricosum]
RGGRRKRRSRERAAATYGRKGGKEDLAAGTEVAGSWQRRQVVGRRRRRRTATALAMGGGRKKTAANEGRKGGSEGPARAAAARFDEEVRKVRTTVAGERGGCGVSVRSAQQWLRLRAREAAAAATLADGRSKGDGATTETTLVNGRSRGDGVAAEVLTTDEGGEEDRAEGVRLLRQERKGRGQWMRRRRSTAGAEEEEGEVVRRVVRGSRSPSLFPQRRSVSASQGRGVATRVCDFKSYHSYRAVRTSLACEPIHKPLATRWSTRYSLVLTDTRLFRAVTTRILTVTTRYRAITAWLLPEKQARSVEKKEKERESVRRRERSRRIGRTSTRPDLAPPSLDDPDPAGNGEVVARATEEAVSFITSSAIAASSSPKAGDICGLRCLRRTLQMRR